MAPLTIYKASAGSGKTFKLTLGYLELIFKDPAAYRHILAVTFTNKAASEMKSRILERLYDMSILKVGEDSEDLKLLQNSTGKNRDELIHTSRQLLVKILNDYSRFSVGTIDRFFQGVIRAFTREIGLPAGFNLELDRDRILGEAIDRMFMGLGEDEELLNWLLRLAESRIEDARGWNFRSEIQSLGEELFSEGYQEIMMEEGSVITREQLKKFIKELEKITGSTLETIKKIAAENVGAMQSAGYSTEDFLRKSSGLSGYFEKVVSGDKIGMTDTQKIGMHDISKWISTKENDQSKIQFIETVFMQGYRSIYEQLILYNSVSEVNQYIYALGILGDLSERILDITNEKNLFLLSDASRFLKGLIGKNPTPFIYEKTGNNIDHIMLDEFQDTSVFQWDNFRPLLEHTLSTGKDNIVVGDVKQSIYRWRNSDWKILADVVGKSFPGHKLEEKSLNDNWRSTELIIRFNNTLFSITAPIIRNLITQSMDGALVSNEFKERWTSLLDVAYDEVEQQIPERAIGSGGFVRAEILQEDGKKQRELALEKIPHWIQELQDSGYKAGDIAILVRTNKEGAELAGLLMENANLPETSEYNFSFVSNDSLYLNKNPAIKFLISLLTYLNNSRDELNNLTLRYYHRYLKNEDSIVTTEDLNSEKSLEEELGALFSGKIPELKRLPLFELVENLIDIFSLDNRLTDLPYIQAFQEITLEIQQEEPGSLHDFLEYWNEFGMKKSITVSEGQDAIRIITIHKAKGLQFKAVIIPFCDWDLTTSASGNRDTILWCNTEGTPFESIPVVPVKFKSSIRETYFAANYLEELIMGYVDSLNLLYVAFTRAEEAMIIGLPGTDKDGKLKRSGHLVMQAAKLAVGSAGNLTMDLAGAINDHGFQVGALPKKEKIIATSDTEWRIDSYPVKFRNDRIRLRMKSSDYFIKGDAASDDHLDFGTIMHEIFGLIRTTADIEIATGKFLRDGLLKKSDAEKINLLIREKISRPEVEGWFVEGLEVLNERDIFSNGNLFRPDRVMIKDGSVIVADYKFGESDNGKYERQVIKYCELLEEMGYNNVEGYLWFVMLDKIVKVK
jgi:ATP-dependent exoDNAse (exonuclease V) beta subunit